VRRSNKPPFFEPTVLWHQLRSLATSVTWSEASKRGDEARVGVHDRKVVASRASQRKEASQVGKSTGSIGVCFWPADSLQWLRPALTTRRRLLRKERSFMARLQSVVPVSDEDIYALPVKDLGPAVAFYETVLGFTAVNHDSSAAVLTRDDVRIGLARKTDHEPSKAGSIAFKVDQLEAMHRELQASGANPGEFGTDEWGGKQYRTFFLREDNNGYCYCFYRPA